MKKTSTLKEYCDLGTVRVSVCGGKVESVIRIDSRSVGGNFQVGATSVKGKRIEMESEPYVCMLLVRK